MTRREWLGLLAVLLKIWARLMDPHPEIVSKQPDPGQPPRVETTIWFEFQVPLP